MSIALTWAQRYTCMVHGDKLSDVCPHNLQGVPAPMNTTYTVLPEVVLLLPFHYCYNMEANTVYNINIYGR